MLHMQQMEDSVLGFDMLYSRTWTQKAFYGHKKFFLLQMPFPNATFGEEISQGFATPVQSLQVS